MTRNNFGKALATATAAVTTLALGATSAGAAALGPAQFAGAAKAQALQLSLTAPAELLGLLGSGPKVIDLGISLTEIASSSTDELSASSHLLTGMLPQGADSDTEGDSYNGSILAQELMGISLGVGTNSFNIDRATRAVTSSSEIAHLTISLDSILAGAANPSADVVGQVNEVVDTVLGEADALVGDIVGEINTVVNELEDTLESTAGLVIDIPDVVLSDLNVVRNLTESPLLTVQTLWSETTVAPVGDKVRSVAKAGIVGASILDGLVEIPEWTFNAWAEAAGTPNSAQWGGDTESLALNIAGMEVVSLDGSILNIAGVELDLNDPSLAGIIPAQEITDVLDGLIGDLLDLTGLSIEQGRVSGDAAADGSFASASVSAFTLSLAPLHAATALPELDGLVNSLGLGSADELFRLQLDLLPVTASASAKAIQDTPRPSSNPETPALPRTGGGALALAMGMLGMGSAAIMRRKF
ncbi:MAG: hypothetical protein ACI867_001580 [Glaciecola sp.]|jgi:hypothetical protein